MRIATRGGNWSHEMRIAMQGRNWSRKMRIATRGGNWSREMRIAMRGGNGHARYEPPSEILHSLIFKLFSAYGP